MGSRVTEQMWKAAPLFKNACVTCHLNHGPDPVNWCAPRPRLVFNYTARRSRKPLHSMRDGHGVRSEANAVTLGDGRSST